MEGESGRRTALLLAGAALLILGLLLPHPPYFAAGASLIAYYFLSLGYVLYAVGRLGVERSCPPNAFEEDEAPVELRLTNYGWLPLAGVELLDHFTPQSISQVRILVPDRLAPRAIYAVGYLGHCFKKRGAYDVGPVEVRISDPLGLVQGRRILPIFDRIVVYPATVPVDPPVLSGGRPTVGSGLERRSRAGLAPVTRGARDYVPGDDPRFVHWPLSARHGRLLVREFDCEVQPQLAIFLDLEKANLRGLGGCTTLEIQVKISASLAATAVRRRVRVSLVGESDRTVDVPAGSTRRHLALVLEELVGVRMEGSVRFYHLVRTEVDRLGPSAAVALLFAAPPEEDLEFADLVANLAGDGHPVVAYVLDRETFPALTEKEQERGNRPRAEEFARLLHEGGARVHVVNGRIELGEQLRRPWHPEPAGVPSMERARDGRRRG